MTKLLAIAMITMAFSLGAIAQDSTAPAGGAAAPAPAVDQAPKADAPAAKTAKKSKKKKGSKKAKKTDAAS